MFLVRHLQRLCDQRLFYERLCFTNVCANDQIVSYLASIDDFSRQLRPDPNGYLDAVAALVTHCSEDRSVMSQHFLFRSLSSVFLSVCLFA